MRLSEIIIKYRTYQGDNYKKDGSLYTISDLSEGTALVNRGQQSNQEILDLAVDAINQLIAALADVTISKGQYLSYSLLRYIPEYGKTYTALLAPTPVPYVIGPAEDSVPFPVDDFAYFVSARVDIPINPLTGVTDSYHCKYAEPEFINQLKEAQYDEMLQHPYIYQEGDLLKLYFLYAPTEWFGTNRTLIVTYIAKQKRIQLSTTGVPASSDDILLNAKFDDKIIDIMIRRYELSIRKLTQP